MRISIDGIHNPLRGRVECSHCGCGLKHIEDKWHEEFAVRASEMLPDVEFDKNHPMGRTPRIFYPIMMQLAADRLARMVDSYLFCPHCGQALQQPALVKGTQQRIVPKTYANNHKAMKQWGDLLGMRDLPLDDYQKMSSIAFAQRSNCEAIFGTW